MPTDRRTEEPAEAADPFGAEHADVAARRCLMCARWIDEARLQEEPDEVLCVEHRFELTRSQPS